MAKCPQGYVIEEALASRCLSCGRYCVISHLRNQIISLQNEIEQLKRK